MYILEVDFYHTLMENFSQRILVNPLEVISNYLLLWVQDFPIEIVRITGSWILQRNPQQLVQDSTDKYTTVCRLHATLILKVEKILNLLMFKLVSFTKGSGPSRSTNFRQACYRLKCKCAIVLVMTKNVLHNGSKPYKELQ